jgi:dTDP-4-dehydrorhamnose reductase
MQKPLIIVTGKNGQLGFELMQLQQKFSNQFDFLFTGRNDLDLLNENEIAGFIEKNRPSYFINAAAYTLVDKAETESDIAFAINAIAPAAIAIACKKNHCQLIHISTDYVFDGAKKTPYHQNDLINPVNLYGASKAKGEGLVLQNNADAIIIRTSWVYSSHGKNFVKTMLKLMRERETINVVADQIGCPTYAADLAHAILQIVLKLNNNKDLQHSNLYHYSNTGNISWFQFAQAIQQIAHLNCTVKPIESAAYPTPAKRSKYSVMDTSNITIDFDVQIKEWEESLKTAIGLLDN